MTRMYRRYGSGVCQSWPLSAEDSLYDETCRAIDEAQAEIMSKPMSLLTVGEYFNFWAHMSKMHVFPNQKTLNMQLEGLRGLLAAMAARAARAEKLGDAPSGEVAAETKQGPETVRDGGGA